MSKHNLFCFIGRTGSGKSTIVNKILEVRPDLTLLKSYTTRPKRNTENNENSDHIFITKSEVDKYREDMIAHTYRYEYESFMTVKQILESDICIINPSGFSMLKDEIEKRKLNGNLVSIYVYTPLENILDRIISNNRDLISWWNNYKNENDEFIDFENNFKHLIDFQIVNVGISFNGKSAIRANIEKIIKFIDEQMLK